MLLTIHLTSTEKVLSVCPSVFYLGAYVDGLRRKLFSEFRSA